MIREYTLRDLEAAVSPLVDLPARYHSSHKKPRQAARKTFKEQIEPGFNGMIEFSSTHRNLDVGVSEVGTLGADFLEYTKLLKTGDVRGAEEYAREWLREIKEKLRH